MEHISGIIKRVMESITVEEDEEIEEEEVEIDHQEDLIDWWLLRRE